MTHPTPSASQHAPPVGAQCANAGKEDAPPFCISEPYRPRKITFDRVRSHGGWRFKTYGVTYGPEPLDQSVYAAAIPLAFATLPEPARTPTRPGVGFLIQHQGRGVHYLVLCWWDNENELPIRILVRPFDQSHWRPAAGSESVCVWDLEIIAFERTAYTRHVLSGNIDLNAYMNERFSAAGEEKDRNGL